MKKMQFHQEGRRECMKTPRLKTTAEDRWKPEAGRLRQALILSLYSYLSNKQTTLSGQPE